MNRRRFLGLLAGARAPSTWAGAPRAWAQPRPAGGRVPPAQPPATRAAGPALEAAFGVTADDIRIGMSAAFRGIAAGLGTEFYRGAQAYYDDVNGKGGVHGRAIRVAALDEATSRFPA
jgi:ABC-type branched-subunit amino acid transport system substrate-binding protein